MPFYYLKKNYSFTLAHKLKKKATILYFLFLVIPGWANSQTIITENLYLNNKYTINPAYAGANNSLDAFINYRNAAVSLEGAPVLIAFGSNMPIFRKMSLGARFYNQSEGLFEVINGFADYSYWIELAKGHVLRFGISAGIQSNQIDFSKIIADDPSAIIDVASRNFNGISFQAGAGFVFQWKNLELSLSLPQLFESKNYFKPNSQLLFLYHSQLNSSNVSIKPSFFVNYKNNSPIVFDINLQTYWKDLFWIGVGYRNRPGIIASVGLRINQLNLGYAIEIGAEKYANMFKQIHEISISYAFQKKKRMPVDSVYIPYIQNITENDSVNIDSTSKIIVTKKEIVEIVNTENSDSLPLPNNNEPKYKIEDAGGGIYVVKSMNTDTTDLVLDSMIVHLVEDSLAVLQLVDQIENEEDDTRIKIVDEGSGIFTIKANLNTNDSLSNSAKITDSELDSLMNSKVLLDKMLAKKEAVSSKNEMTLYYTIQLFINNSNQHFLTNSEIVGEARIEKSIDGEINYFYGYYNTEEEVLQVVQKFEKYKNLKVKVLKVDLNQ